MLSGLVISPLFLPSLLSLPLFISPSLFLTHSISPLSPSSLFFPYLFSLLSLRPLSLFPPSLRHFFKSGPPTFGKESTSNGMSFSLYILSVFLTCARIPYFRRIQSLRTRKTSSFNSFQNNLFRFVKKTQIDIIWEIICYSLVGFQVVDQVEKSK